MPDSHARLSPSASARWLSCPASVLAIEALGRNSETSVYAEEGTKAHALAELEAGLAFGKITKKQHSIRYRRWLADSGLTGAEVQEMRRYVGLYVDVLRELLNEEAHSIIRLEQRLNSGIPTCWGTSDAIIVSPSKVKVIDLKYGQGVAVSAVENSQLMIYGLGALDEFGDILGETNTVELTIFQPRLGQRSTYAMTAADLRAWRDQIIPVAKAALKPGADFGPSEKACRWCPLAGDCRARTEAMTAEDFAAAPVVLSDQELADVWLRIGEIRKWCSAVEEAALDRAYSQGHPLPGLKVVLSGGQRTINDQAEAIQNALAAGYEVEQVASFKLKGIGELEKLMGKDQFATVFDTLITKTTGKPALVPESDKRPAIQPNTEAVKEFTDD